MPYLDLPSGIRIRYVEGGPRDGRPLVLAHGFGVSRGMWFPQEWALSQAHRLITWDARGHGGSSAPEDPLTYTMPALAEDLRGLLEGLDAVDGAIIGGMSFGGMIALQYAVDHAGDMHALILSDTSTRGDALESPARVSPADSPGMAGCRHAMRTRADLTPALPGLDIPVLVIAGEWDDAVLAALPRLANGLRRRRVETLRECTHGTSAQRPDEWSAEVLRFLADVEAGHPLGEDEMR
ncbi:MAG: alpha/beta fold hydrolase [Dehalococcoidia bacterium]